MNQDVFFPLTWFYNEHECRNWSTTKKKNIALYLLIVVSSASVRFIHGHLFQPDVLSAVHPLFGMIPRRPHRFFPSLPFQSFIIWKQDSIDFLGDWMLLHVQLAPTAFGTILKKRKHIYMHLYAHIHIGLPFCLFANSLNRCHMYYWLSRKLMLACLDFSETTFALLFSRLHPDGAWETLP